MPPCDVQVLQVQCVDAECAVQAAGENVPAGTSKVCDIASFIFETTKGVQITLSVSENVNCTNPNHVLSIEVSINQDQLSL